MIDYDKITLLRVSKKKYNKKIDYNKITFFEVFPKRNTIK